MYGVTNQAVPDTRCEKIGGASPDEVYARMAQTKLQASIGGCSPAAPRASASDLLENLVGLAIGQRHLLAMLEQNLYGPVPAGKEQEFFVGDGILHSLEGLRHILLESNERLERLNSSLGAR